jgi:hypothetical protein
MRTKLMACTLWLACALLAGCMTTVPRVDAQHAGSVETKRAIANSIQTPRIDANGYLVTPLIRATMLHAFYERAAQLGLKVSNNGDGVPVTIRITGVRSRSDTARILFNFMDGADYLDAVVQVGDRSFKVQEHTWLYWAFTGFRTVTDVASAVGEQTANGIALMAEMPIDD